MKIFVIIPTYNRVAITRRCVASLCEQKFRGFEILLIDDASTDGTSERMREEFGGVVRITVFPGNGSLFWGGAVEVGMKEALSVAGEEDLIMTLNDDVILPPDFLMKCIELKERYTGALIGGVSCEAGREGRIAVTGWRMRCWALAWTQRVWWPMTVEELKSLPTEVADVDFLPGTATVIDAWVVRRWGPVKGKLLPHYHADSEFSFRLKKNGVRVLIARDLRIQHNLETTGDGGSEFTTLSPTNLLRSFFSIRSGNCLKYKWRFAQSCCPTWAIPSYYCCNVLKAVVRACAICFFGGRSARAMKGLFNRV